MNDSKDIIIKPNIIEGILDIKLEEINKGVKLFSKYNKNLIEVYLNDKKVNMINDDEKWFIEKNYFQEDGKYKFKIIFIDSLINLFGFFSCCSNLYSLDFSNLDTSNVVNMRSMFNGCDNLKEIKGINKFNTSNVENMNSMFNQCYKLEYLDLSNFNTSNVFDMENMFVNVII